MFVEDADKPLFQFYWREIECSFARPLDAPEVVAFGRPLPLKDIEHSKIDGVPYDRAQFHDGRGCHGNILYRWIDELSAEIRWWGFTLLEEPDTVRESFGPTRSGTRVYVKLAELIK
jgi:hypothetical protein